MRPVHTATALVATANVLSFWSICTEFLSIFVTWLRGRRWAPDSFSIEGMVQLEDAFERHRVAKLHRPLARATSTNPSAREDRHEHQSPRRPSILLLGTLIFCWDCARVGTRCTVCTLPRRGKGHQLGSEMRRNRGGHRAPIFTTSRKYPPHERDDEDEECPGSFPRVEPSKKLHRR